MPAAWELINQEPQSAPVTQSGAQVIGRPTVVGQVTPAQMQAAPQVQKKLAILVPHTGEVSSEWCLMFREIPLPVGSQIFMSRGMPIDVTRESMVKTALDAGFEWIFFLDSDVILPKDTFQKLFSHNLPLISGLYKAKKPNGFFWAAWMKGKTPDGKDAFVPVANWNGRLFEVDVIGTGCMLIHRSVFEGIRAKTDLPLFVWAKERNPTLLDKMNIPDSMMREVSEDFWFCLLAKHCGFKVVVDGEVKCGHISTVKITDTTVTLPGV
jgi:hypothetical protein